MKISSKKIAMSLLVATLFVGCADKTPQLTSAAIMQQYANLSSLNKQLNNAEISGVDYLAPKGYLQARAIYDEAFELAQNKKPGAEKLASEGLAVLEKSVAQAEVARPVMQQVLDARAKAISASSPQLYAQKFEDLEEELKDATRALEAGKIEKGKNARIELIKSYAKLELKSLQGTTTKNAEEAIAEAKEAQAEEYAPKTLKLSQEELALALNILGTGRTQTEKSARHAAKSVYFANKSIQISKIVQELDAKSLEEVLLWYQTQLETLYAPFGDKLLFDQENGEVIKQIRNEIAMQIESRKLAQASLEKTKQKNLELKKELLLSNAAYKQKLSDSRSAYEEKITAIKRKSAMQMATLEAQKKGSEASLKQEIEQIQKNTKKAQERYDRISTMFTPDEANVYRQGNNVLLETHAFNFAVGKSEISKENYALLEKILKATHEFKTPHLLIRGHTDSSGGDALNMKLSEERAQAVVSFLQKIGNIDPKRIEAKGYGETQPVASNDNAEGRARNRRIEVLIINN